MKRFVSIIILLLVLSQIELFSQTKVNLTSGWSISSPDLSLEKYRIHRNLREPQNYGNFFFGFFVEPRINHFLFLRTGIVYSTNSIKNYFADNFFSSYSFEFTINNLEFPIGIYYKKEIKKLALSIGIGGYLSYSIKGYEKITHSKLGVIVDKLEEKITFEQTQSTKTWGVNIDPTYFSYGIKHYDYGLSPSIIVEYRAVQIYCSYYYGLENIVFLAPKYEHQPELQNDKIKNRFIKIGFCFDLCTLLKK